MITDTSFFVKIFFKPIKKLALMAVCTSVFQVYGVNAQSSHDTSLVQTPEKVKIYLTQLAKDRLQAHEARLDYCAGLVAQHGDLNLNLAALQQAGFTKTTLLTAINHYYLKNTEDCEQPTRLALLEVHAMLRLQLGDKHPEVQRLDGISAQILPTEAHLAQQLAYELLTEQQRDLMKVFLAGKLYSNRQIKNFAELRAGLSD